MVKICDVVTDVVDGVDDPLSVDDLVNISFSGRYYVIRKTRNRVTYYFGSYDSLDECVRFRDVLGRLGFPVMLSHGFVGLDGREYTDYLRLYFWDKLGIVV